MGVRTKTSNWGQGFWREIEKYEVLKACSEGSQGDVSETLGKTRKRYGNADEDQFLQFSSKS